MSSPTTKGSGRLVAKLPGTRDGRSFSTGVGLERRDEALDVNCVC